MSLDLPLQPGVTFLFSKRFIVFNQYNAKMIDRVKACSVNPIDCKVRGGVYDDAPGTKIPQPSTIHHPPSK
jgi:hypothetical protein